MSNLPIESREVFYFFLLYYVSERLKEFIASHADV